MDPVAAIDRYGTADSEGPQFAHDWERRAFGLAVALSEFGHYPWETFQQRLIDAVAAWEATPAAERGEWSYYDCWLEALTHTVVSSGLVTRAELDMLLADERPGG